MNGVGIDEMRVAATELMRTIVGRCDKEPSPVKRAKSNAIYEVCRQWLAEHPEDDGEPVTHKWLRRVGFTRGMQAASTDVLSLWSERNHISIEIDDDGYVRVAIGDSDVSEYLPAGFSMQTRGDVRRLCKALGVSLVG